MAVQLRLDAYPYQEAGFIKARIGYISPIASDSGFLAQAIIDLRPDGALRRGLVSSQGKHIQYRNGLSAQALVITKNMRLLERIYYNIIKSFSPK